MSAANPSSRAELLGFAALTPAYDAVDALQLLDRSSILCRRIPSHELVPFLSGLCLGEARGIAASDRVRARAKAQA